ncbi:tryptophan halogenase family protein [Gilvimarinus xylanilyticus]|uniref:Tryptophan 7-halogenase n=1 Tax=Gilvimarinus xylanilyticus TaxID=2944139 RepID=A0A9X2KRS2_9GAMM|nr:tryptophan halogenase family protein [Gilvimarinus xylanilyticus]MCP8898151.1 tryptophan 7-halogenase [Gilvimarinus xylanilyticus]
MSGSKKRIVIAGGGTAGWIAAAALSHQMGELLDITLVESEDIGTVGVGEATIPPMRTFHRLVGINEQEFVKATNATFKLGIQFENWKQIGEKYFHSFGVTGKQTIVTDFIHFWLRGRELGIANDFGDYCLEFKAALQERFSLNNQAKLNYAFHLDAGRYARFLRARAESFGVKRVEGKIAQVNQNSDSGDLTSLVLESGQELSGDLFIDCTGMKGLLIEQTLKTGFEPWVQWLPCDTAIAVQTEATAPPLPYTRSVAHHAGWRWQIPLQNRVGNGIVFSSRHMSEDEAKDKLLSSVEGKALTEPNLIRFKTGRRKKSWNKNCIAMGLASGFLEPLESTSIHMIMTAVTRLLQLFPHGEIKQSVVDEYNAQAESEFDRIRDFIILHYKATERDDSPFWQYCRDMEVPAELKHRMDLFRDFGRANQVEGELFRLDSWTQVMLGQGIIPSAYHPMVDLMPESALRSLLASISADVDKKIEMLSPHAEFVKKYCGIS